MSSDPRLSEMRDATISNPAFPTTNTRLSLAIPFAEGIRLLSRPNFERLYAELDCQYDGDKYRALQRRANLDVEIAMGDSFSWLEYLEFLAVGLYAEFGNSPQLAWDALERWNTRIIQLLEQRWIVNRDYQALENFREKLRLLNTKQTNLNLNN